MALNTITSGVDTSFSTKLNNNFKIVAKPKLQYYQVPGFSVSNASMTTISTLDLTSSGVDVGIYGFTVRLEIQLSATNGASTTLQCLVTFYDDTTTTVAIGTHGHSAGSNTYGATHAYYAGDKKIKSIALQSQTSNSGNVQLYGEEAFSLNFSNNWKAISRYEFVFCDTYDNSVEE